MTLLGNLKVLDFSTLLPGPYATLLLADLGAEVLHVRRPNNQEASIIENYLNRSKQSISLDLKKEESIKTIKELVKSYDIVLEQFRPGVMDRLGLGYEELKKMNPQIIYCSLTGFGQTGPYKARAGHDINYISIAGLSSYSGTKQGGPANNSTQIADIAGGSLHSVIAILSAVIYRDRTGEGQYIDISMSDCSFAMNALFAPQYLVQGQNLQPEELLLNGGTFYGYCQTKDARYFSVGSLEPQFRLA
jgi:alpha-methylacyl-CoA racemase